MPHSYESSEAARVLSVDEIASLYQEGKPADTLMNVVALIASRFNTDVCSTYLLQPDRSNLVLAATVGLHPRSIGTLRMPLNEGLAGLVAEMLMPVAVADARNHPRFKFFKESGEEEYRSFLGVPLIDRGVLQGVLVVQTKEARTFRDDEIQLLADAAGEVAPSVSEARTLDRFIAPAQERLWALANNIWWCWDPECISLFNDLNPVRWRQLNQNPIALLKEIPLHELERRASELGLHSRINYCYRRQQEYLHADQTWGANNAGVLRPRPVGVFLGGVRAARIAADLFGRPGRAGRRPHQERIGPGHSAGRRGAVLRAGIFSAAARRRRLAARGLHRNRRRHAPDADCDRSERRAGDRRDCDALGVNPLKGVARQGGPLRPAPARLERGRQRAGGS